MPRPLQVLDELALHQLVVAFAPGRLREHLLRQVDPDQLPGMLRQEGPAETRPAAQIQAAERLPRGREAARDLLADQPGRPVVELLQLLVEAGRELVEGELHVLARGLGRHLATRNRRPRVYADGRIEWSATLAPETLRPPKPQPLSRPGFRSAAHCRGSGC